MSGISEQTLINPEFSVRIVVCDHYLTRPIPGIDVIYSEFRGSDIKQVPVLRIFGPTPEGRKACVHIHGVFPYFYIPCPTSHPEPQYLYQIAASLDKALNIALKQATSANQHVYKISLVKGLPFYGYHDKEHLYLKVFLYNPGLMKQAVELCSNGALLGQTFQPHESHLNFTLQFFIDFNLFGMSNIDLQTVKFRRLGMSQSSNDPLECTDERLKAESSCFYEADCMASHIINRQRVGKGDGIENPGLEEVWQQEKERRKQLNMSVASKSLSQGRLPAEETETHYKFEQMFLIKISNLVDQPVITDQNAQRILEAVYYPAESLEGSQLLDAVDVSVHQPNTTLGVSVNESVTRSFDDTLTEDLDNTFVDEHLALNCSLHYSQVQLNSEDLDLIDILQGMDEKTVEEDSVMGTPANVDNDEIDLDGDDEFLQAYNDETICLNHDESKGDDTLTEGNSQKWNDSFWDAANIPQLDGTFDDDHVKKVRKRKMRPFKLGLSRPKAKKKPEVNSEETPDNINLSNVDEINVSRETIEDISDAHLKRTVKTEPKSVKCSPNHEDEVIESPSILELVEQASKNNETVNNILQSKTAEVYDEQKGFIPAAGSSKTVFNEISHPDESYVYSSDSSLDENNTGITSFYTSKVFDLSLEATGNSTDEKVFNNHEIKVKIENYGNSSTLNDLRSNTYNETDQFSSTRPDRCIILTPKIKPPTKSYIEKSLQQYKIPKVVYPAPYYSNYKDVGSKVEIGQMVLKLQSKLSRDQKPFEKVSDVSLEEWRQLLFTQNEMSQETKPDNLRTLLAGNKACILEPVIRPPTSKNIKQWIENNIKNEVIEKKICDISKNLEELDNSQALGLNEDDNINISVSGESNEKEKSSLDNSVQVTMQPDGSFLCFGSNSILPKETLSFETPAVDADFLTIMIVELHTSVRGELNPDPMFDPIEAVFVAIKNESPPNHYLQQNTTEILVVDNMTPPKYLDRCIFKNVTYVNNERELIEKVIDLVKYHDPDIMCGYEIEMNSWGYLLERAQILEYEIVRELSRITEKYRQKRFRGENEKDFESRIIGRIVFNVWRLFRHELALSSYSFENCMFEILKERVPKYSYAQLAEWWGDETRILRWITCEYYLTRLSGTVRMLEKLDIINRTSELARLFGLQWWEVLTRGSQFRVESLMLRAARPLNLIALSPTVKQRAAMRAPECLPLIFEPESRFYSDPVIILDFQSLYPSMMIAYNYCFSTCIGRVQNINGDAAYEFGAWRLRISKSKLEALVKKGLVHWSPVGVGFVKPSVRRGVLPALLRRILAARQAVKKSMKMQTDETVKKAMHSRQLGLKLIANVTYGYTAANFSGRMPCVEVGDSVVSKGRETLERAIKLVKNNSKWNVKVVYGDTDSMFVLAPGATRAEAFDIGQQIADAVTADNPSPVALKLEKVYQPCILQTKKRYVGFMYESADQEKPVYEAKGIETVRRDGCPAGVKLLQTALCELFETGDMSRVKRTVCSVLSRLSRGAVPLQDLLFTREYHGPAGYRQQTTAPPNEIALRLLASDRRAGPRTGERVSWLITAGAPGAALCRLARSPREVARDPALTPHVHYYAARALLPPLHRCLSLQGAVVLEWWNELGYTREAQQRETVRGGIARYMGFARCAGCGAKGVRGAALCPPCAQAAPLSVRRLTTRGANASAALRNCDTICTSCCGHTYSSVCENTECPVFWKKITARKKLNEIREVIAHLPSEFSKEMFDF